MAVQKSKKSKSKKLQKRAHQSLTNPTSFQMLTTLSESEISNFLIEKFELFSSTIMNLIICVSL